MSVFHEASLQVSVLPVVDPPEIDGSAVVVGDSTIQSEEIRVVAGKVSRTAAVQPFRFSVPITPSAVP
jgi:hypothetical protein